MKASGKITPVSLFAERKGSRGVSLSIAENGGEATLNARPSGTVNAETRAGFSLKRGNRTATVDNCTVALTGKKALLRCDGTSLFQGPLKGDRIEPDAAFTRLAGRVPAKVTKAGARFLNRKLRSRLDAGQKAGSIGLDAERLLKVVSGNSETYYDPAFYDALQACDIDLLPIAPAIAIPTGPNAPRGGVILPQRGTGGTLNAISRDGQIPHDGGTQLKRKPGSSRGAYESNLTNYVFSLGTNSQLVADVQTPTLRLTAFTIGNVVGGTFTFNLTDTGGSVTFSGADLVLSDLASGQLRGDTGCDIPAGSKIGTVQATSNVE